MDRRSMSAGRTRSIRTLNRRIERCELCPRLVHWRRRISREKVKRFADWTYWGKPVPGFGDPRARLLIIGLAPAAHGANRTGRMFTGDRSGDWLYRALHRYGFANQETSLEREDGLELNDCFITAACRCAPPQNKPSAQELRTCRRFLRDELRLLSDVRVIIGLGRIGFDTAFEAASSVHPALNVARPAFGHGVHVRVPCGMHLLGSYHPSQQNTFTGRLTEKMFNAVFTKAVHLLKSDRS